MSFDNHGYSHDRNPLLPYEDPQTWHTTMTPDRWKCNRRAIKFELSVLVLGAEVHQCH